MYNILDPYDRSDKRAARKSFTALMAARPQRIVDLTAWLANQGVVLGDTREQLDTLEQWLITNAVSTPDQNGNPTTARLWGSICQDVGMYLGDLLITRHPFLHWTFPDLSEKYEERFAPAVTGFPVPNKKWGPAYPLRTINLVVMHFNNVPLKGSFNTSLTNHSKIAVDGKL